MQGPADGDAGGVGRRAAEGGGDGLVAGAGFEAHDDGPAVQGRQIDVYMWSCHEALEFGRREIAINVLRLGWNPKASTPTLIDRLFHQRELAQRAEAPSPLPSRPIEIR